MRVECDRDRKAVWSLTLYGDRPGEPPALSAAAVGAIGDFIAEADRTDACRMVVLRGADSAFCAGLDLAAFTAATAETVEDGARAFAETLRLLRECSKVLLAAVDGDALGGGLGLACAADLVIATHRARFGLPETVFGLVPAIILPVLLERVPPQKVRRLALCSGRVDPVEAMALGLVDRVVASEPELDAAVAETARHVLRLEPGAVSRLKRLCRTLPELPRREAAEAGLAETLAAHGREEVIGAIRGFLEGESLPWFARYRRSGDGR